MNYQKLYDALIAKAQKRWAPEGYFEEHHITPASFYINHNRKGPKGWLEGNPDDPSNLVNLTALEHIKAHKYLANIYGGLMWNAYNFLVFRKGVQLSDKEAAKLREELGKSQSQRQKDYFANTPGALEANRQRVKAFFAKNPEAAKVHSQRLKDFYANNPEAAKVHSQRLKDFYANNPEARELVRQKTKEYFANTPGALEANRQRLKDFYANNPEARELVRQKTKAQFANPEFRKNHSEGRKKYFANNPGARETASQKAKNYYVNNPEAVKACHERQLAKYGKTIKITFDNGETITRLGLGKAELEFGCANLNKMAKGAYKTISCKAPAYASRKIIAARYI